MKINYLVNYSNTSFIIYCCFKFYSILCLQRIKMILFSVTHCLTILYNNVSITINIFCMKYNNSRVIAQWADVIVFIKTHATILFIQWAPLSLFLIKFGAPEINNNKAFFFPIMHYVNIRKFSTTCQEFSTYLIICHTVSRGMFMDRLESLQTKGSVKL